MLSVEVVIRVHIDVEGRHGRVANLMHRYVANQKHNNGKSNPNILVSPRTNKQEILNPRAEVSSRGQFPALS